MKLIAGYHSSLAGEFYVLSVLHRLGVDAHVTLGNRKSVDVLIEGRRGLVTLDVKTIQGTSDWPAGNLRASSANHFVVFLSWTNIGQLERVPRVWVIPARRVRRFLKAYGDRVNVSGLRTQARLYEGCVAPDQGRHRGQVEEVAHRGHAPRGTGRYRSLTHA